LGNHLEELKGDLAGFHSVRINDQWTNFDGLPPDLPMLGLRIITRSIYDPDEKKAHDPQVRS
jgi:hypothetical protein